MKAAALLMLLAALALLCVRARGQDEPEQIPVRVQCDGARVAVIQLMAPAAGRITLRLPPDICGRSA